MATMLNVYDRETRKKTAVLQNAFDIVETHELNQIYTLSFTLPSEDEKNQYCLPRHFVRWGDNGELYRIKTPDKADSDVGTVTYHCEHVITTLCDSIMFGSYQYGGQSVHTRATITWLLSQQKEQNWVLDVCDFDRQFEYLWEQENILNALYSIPKEFAKPYKWTFDTTVYPWKISLREIDPTATPEFYLRAKSNILSSGTSADYANICTRIYPLGYGEGVNQLNIKDATVKNIRRDSSNVAISADVDETSTTKYGNTYIQSPQAITDKYGIVEKVLVDRRFEQANTLFAYAKSMLDVYQEPSMSRTFDVVDLYPLTSFNWNDAEVGKICRMTGDNTTAYITKTQWQRDKAGDLHIDLSTKATDIAQSVADLADRVRIESVYAQGATQLYQHSKDANATPQKGMVISLYFPAEMRQINKVLLRMKLEKFRSYSQTTDAGGASTQTSSAGGKSTRTSSEGGASTRTSSEGGKSTQTSTAGGAYTQTTNSGGSSTQTSTAGGSYTQTTESGGGSTQTSSSGGGSASTSAGTGSSSISISSSSDAVWSDIPDSEVFVSDDDRNQDSGRDQLWDGEDGTGTTDIPNPSEGGEDHTHGFGKVYKHYHNVIIWVSFKKSKFSHSHKINLSGVGSHSHTVSFNAHTHSVTIPKHTHGLNIPNHTHNVSIPSHTHGLNIPSHTHNVSIPNHTHTVSIPNHTHTVDIPNHTHTVDIPSHTHNISAGIFESGNPTSFDIYIGNTKKATVTANSYDGDITQWLLNNKNQVPRDTWIDMKIVPNDLAYVVSSVFVQGFVQSRGGGNY